MTCTLCFTLPKYKHDVHPIWAKNENQAADDQSESRNLLQF